MNSMSGQKLKGIPYTGTLPAVLAGTKAGYLHRYKIYGNLEQTGTPTPENPIVPSECGERTGNYFDADSNHQGYYNNSGNFVANNKYICSQPILVSEQNYTISAINSYAGGGYIFQLVYFNANDEYISLNSASLYGVGKKSLTGSVPSSTTKIIAVVTSDSSECMLVEGSTAPTTYIPFGYKLPLLSGSTPVDIYIGESQTTRRIRKLVLTGEENWSLYEEGNVWQFYTNNIISGLANSSCMSNIAEYGATATTRGRYIYGAYLVSSGRGIAFQMIGSKDAFVDVASWKAYLAQQYANGTPVTVWYVLATPTTGILNEPLRKIGDYADTIDSTQTSAQIPTSANSTTISWGGQGLAPSQFDSIQEWVDIPTYTRVNGAWVADN